MSKNRAASDYQMLGVKIASAVLSSGRSLQEGDHLTREGLKVAKAEDLNRHQIERVAEHCNHRTFRELFEKRAGDGDVQFQPMDSEKIVAQLNLPEKVAADFSDYYAPPENQKVAMDVVLRTQFGDLGGLVPELEKRASFEATFAPVLGEHQTLEAFEKAASQTLATAPMDEASSFDMVTKLAEVVRHFDTRLMALKDLAGQEREKFAELCERMVRAGTKIEDIYKAAMVARPDQKESLDTLFGWVISRLHKHAVFGTKTAGDVDPKLISKKLDALMPHGVTVIAKNHAVTLAINLIADLAEQWDDAQKGKWIATEALNKAKAVHTSITPRKGSYTGKVQGL